MAETTAVIAAADQLRVKDEEALALEIGLRCKRIESDPSAADNPALSVTYGTHMGMIDDVRALGWRILTRWNKEIHVVVCSSEKPEAQVISKNVFAALSVDEAALIAAIAPALIWLGAPAAIAAAVAPLVVKKFIIPAKEELCAAWGEAIGGSAA
jgi:hypothetical protein